MSSFAEFCIIALATIVSTEIYVAINDLSLEKSFPIGVIGRISILGILLTLNEYLFFKYLKKVVFRKQFGFNDDFIGVWLEITNFVIAFCFGGVFTHGADYVKHYGNPYLAQPDHHYHSLKYVLNTLSFI